MGVLLWHLLGFFGKPEDSFTHNIALDLAGAHHLVEQFAEHGRSADLFADFARAAEVHEPDPVGCDDHVVHAQVQVHDARLLVDGGE